MISAAARYLALACLLSTATIGAAQQPSSAATQHEGLRIGHWVEIKGTYLGAGLLEAESLEVSEPADTWELVGTVERAMGDKGRFLLNGQVIHVSDKTKWRKLAWAQLGRSRVKVEGIHRSPRKFSARTIGPRGPGRDAIVGRIDRLRRTDTGLELIVASLRIALPANVHPFFSSPASRLPLAPLDHKPLGDDSWTRRDEDDDIPGRIPLGEHLTLGLRLEAETRSEQGYDLDRSTLNDEVDLLSSLTAELVWNPSPSFTGLVRGRFSRNRFDEDGTPVSTIERPRLSEAWGYVRQALGSKFDVQLGRQDFDEPREWLYDQNMDALRIISSRPGLRTELSTSTTLTDGSDRDEASTNLIAYVSNNDEDRHLAAYVIDRRDARAGLDYPLHIGARALGEWLPNNKVWAEASLLRGHSQNINFEGYAFDFGTTWMPDFAGPLYFTLGYATGSGDDPSTTGVDESFRQSGLQDNNDKFGGVTSFRYYGELMDPELANLSIMTLGLGSRLGRRTSVDLVYHDYSQAIASASQRNTDLDENPDGIHRDLGRELDLIIGIREIRGVDLELVAARYWPGDAFPDGDRAWLGAFQVRWRF
ncbi:MAG: alginate export family protein [Planctomycetota bacterium]|nr:hypothetical protein [Planctomycetota bacterium]MDP6518745.1 alginate export family protein [Planctomycetota bacterium]MDP6837496.1 alginate export family protein [Planctomycetota bacterium]